MHSVYAVPNSDISMLMVFFPPSHYSITDLSRGTQVKMGVVINNINGHGKGAFAPLYSSPKDVLLYPDNPSKISISSELTLSTSKRSVFSNF